MGKTHLKKLQLVKIPLQGVDKLINNRISISRSRAWNTLTIKVTEKAMSASLVKLTHSQKITSEFYNVTGLCIFKVGSIN